MAWSSWQPVGVSHPTVLAPVAASDRNSLECYGVSDPSGSTNPDDSGAPLYNFRFDGTPRFADGWADVGSLGRDRRIRPRLAVAVEPGNGTRHVFATDTDRRRVYTSTGAGGPDGFAGNWGALPGRQGTEDWHSERGPAAAWVGDTLFVFVVGLDGRLWRWRRSGTTWSTPSALSGPSAGITSVPTMVSPGPGQLELFVVGSDGRLYRRILSNHRWGSWGRLRQGDILTLQGDPVAVSWETGRVDIFVRGTRGGDEAWLWHNWRQGRDWDGWNIAAGGGPGHGSRRMAGSPGAVSRAAGAIDLFAADRGGRVYHASGP